METSFKGLADDINNIPLADEDAPDDGDESTISRLDMNHGFPLRDPSFESLGSNDQQNDSNDFDQEIRNGEIEERARLIQQVLELQKTTYDLSLRVARVKEENLKLKSEIQVVSQDIGNRMSTSSVFQSTSKKLPSMVNSKRVSITLDSPPKN